MTAVVPRSETPRAPGPEDSAPQLRHRLEFGALRIILGVLARLPEAVGARCGAAAGWFAGSVLRIRRRHVEEHLELVPGVDEAARARIARASYAHLGRELAAFARMSRWPAAEIERRIDFVGFEEVRKEAEGEHGAILLTAHLGNWEMAGAGIAALGIPLAVVMKGMSNPLVERDLFSRRQRLGMEVVEMSAAPREVMGLLRKGRVTALLWDQNAHRRGAFVPFLGKAASTHRGPAFFALRTGAPVFVGFALREPGWRHRYTLEAHRLEIERTGDPAEDERLMIRGYNRLLEAAIRTSPDQYFWHHRRWKTRPAEEAGGTAPPPTG